MHYIRLSTVYVDDTKIVIFDADIGMGGPTGWNE